MKLNQSAEDIVSSRAIGHIECLPKDAQEEIHAYVKMLVEKHSNLPPQDVVIKNRAMQSSIIAATILLIPLVFGLSKGCAEHDAHINEMEIIRKEEGEKRILTYENEISILKSELSVMKNTNNSLLDLKLAMNEYCSKMIYSEHEDENFVDKKVNP